MIDFKNILVIGAHFDDAELGCGGIMKKFSNDKNVYKLTLTNNMTLFEQYNIKVNFESSLENSKEACKILGVKELTDLGFVECNHLKYNTELMQKIEKKIFDLNIDTVFIHYFDDINQDHVQSSILSRVAARHINNIFFYQSNGYILQTKFYPTIFFDISNEYEYKKKALYCYSNEHNRFDRLFDITLKKAEIYGYANKCKYAEGFVPMKILYQ